MDNAELRNIKRDLLEAIIHAVARVEEITGAKVENVDVDFARLESASWKNSLRRNQIKIETPCKMPTLWKNGWSHSDEMSSL